MKNKEDISVLLIFCHTEGKRSVEISVKRTKHPSSKICTNPVDYEIWLIFTNVAR